MNHTWMYRDIINDSQSPLGLTRSCMKGDYPLHKHDFSELVIVLGGTGTHRLNGMSHRISPGTTFVVKPKDEHGYFDNKDLEIVNVIMFGEDMLTFLGDLRALPGFQYLFVMEHESGPKKQINCHQLSAAELVKCRKLLESMTDEYDNRRPGYQAKLKSSFLDLAVTITRSYEHPKHISDDTTARLGHGLAYMEENFTRDIRVPEIAEKANISLRQFQRLFLSLYGMSPVQYLLSLRVQAAKAQLMNTDAPIGEIAALCGFGDSNYFSRQFRKTTGHSPREFRQMTKELSAINRPVPA